MKTEALKPIRLYFISRYVDDGAQRDWKKKTTKIMSRKHKKRAYVGEPCQCSDRRLLGSVLCGCEAGMNMYFSLFLFPCVCMNVSCARTHLNFTWKQFNSLGNDRNVTTRYQWNAIERVTLKSNMHTDTHTHT